VVGRERSCDIVVADKDVSRRHCLFQIDPPAVWLRDLDSTHGTLVNSEPGRGMVELHDGDAVRVGPMEIQVNVELSGCEDRSDLFAQCLNELQWK